MSETPHEEGTGPEAEATEPHAERAAQPKEFKPFAFRKPRMRRMGRPKARREDAEASQEEPDR